MKTISIAIAAATLITGLMPSAQANTFAAWQVTDVAFGDVLNVRKYPASTSQKAASYPNGTVLQMTGRCTGSVDLHAIAGQAPGAQRAAVRYRWCEVWHDPKNDGDFVTGWAYGRYIKPY